MAVDRKTGKPLPDAATPLEVGRAFAEDLANAGLIPRARVGAVAEDLARAALADQTPPPADPRGVSVLLGAYGPWLAAQELLREGRP
jgi:hypothetical protein